MNDKKARVERLRQKYMADPPDGYSKAEIKKMRDEDLLDMDYFLHEEFYDLGIDLEDGD